MAVVDTHEGRTRLLKVLIGGGPDQEIAISKQFAPGSGEEWID
jgi:hypothetical protein